MLKVIVQSYEMRELLLSNLEYRNVIKIPVEVKAVDKPESKITLYFDDTLVANIPYSESDTTGINDLKTYIKYFKR